MIAISAPRPSGRPSGHLLSWFPQSLCHEHPMVPAPPHDAPDVATGPRALALQVQGLVRVYRVGLRRRPHVALRGIDLELAPGRTIGFVGPNGSGKSTLLRILAGVDRPTAGAARVFGAPPSSRAARERLSYLPDGDPFPGELQALAALTLVARLRGFRGFKARALAEEGLAAVELSDRAGTRLGAFSRGMHRRFGLAQAFLGAPDLVLLDEPTAGLDAPGFDALARLLEAARMRGATVALASHVPADLVDHCDEAVLLVDGAIQARADARELLGDRDLSELVISGGAESAARAGEILHAAGIEVTSAAPARRSLADLYRGSGWERGR